MSRKEKGKNRTKLTASDRLILAEMRLFGRTANAGDILTLTRISIHTLVDSLARLKHLNLIEQVETGCGPGYNIVTPKLLESTEVAS